MSHKIVIKYCLEFGNSFLEGHNPLKYLQRLLKIKHPPLQQNFLVIPPLQTIFFSTTFFFSFVLKLKKK